LYDSRAVTPCSCRFLNVTTHHKQRPADLDLGLV
jgi:hypothetical protein